MRENIIGKEGFRKRTGRMVAALAAMVMLCGSAAAGTTAAADTTCTPDTAKNDTYATYTLTSDCTMHIGPGLMRDIYSRLGAYVGPFYLQKHLIRRIVIDDPANTKVPDRADYLFRFEALETIDGIEDLNVSNVTSMMGMFKNDSHLTGVLDLSHWDTSHVTTMGEMFREAGDGSLTLRTKGWDTSKVASMYGMFNSFAGFPEDIGDMDVSHTQDLSYMFFSFASPKAVDLSAWDTSSATNMQHMFKGADVGLIKGLDGFDVSKAENLGFMFQEAKNSAGESGIVDLSAWRTTAAKDMTYMFYGTNLGFFKGISDLDVSHATSVFGIFRDVKTDGMQMDLSSWDTSKVTDMSQMFLGDNLDDFKGISGLDVSSATNLNDMFYSAKCSKTLDLSAWDTGSAINMGYMFESFHGPVKGIESLDTSSAANFDGMFQNMKAVEPIDLSAWDTRNASSMTAMFSGSEGFFGMGSWNTANIMFMNSMFASSKPAKTIDLSSWDTSKVTRMDQVFSNTTGYTGMTGWDTSKVTNMYSTFWKFTPIGGTLDLSAWDTGNADNMNNMFRDMKGTLIIDKPWNTSQVTSMHATFANLANPRIDMTGSDTSKVTDMSSMFYGVDLSQVKGIPGLNVDKVTDFRGMFADARIDHLDLSKWNKQSTARDGYMLVLKRFITITTGPNMSFRDNPFEYEYNNDANPEPSIFNIWQGSTDNITPMTWSQIPDNPDDPASYWTSTKKYKEADRELIDRINSVHAGTWIMTRSHTVFFECVHDCTNRPNSVELTWPVSPDSSRMPDNVPVSRDWRFKGWLPREKDTGISEPIKPGQRLPSEFMLYDSEYVAMIAQWDRIQRTISYHDDSDDGSGIPGKDVVDSGDGFTLPDTVPTRRGYGFVGWSMDDDPTIYKPGDRIPEVTSDITLHAVWSAQASRLPEAGEHADWRLMIVVLALLVSAMIAGGTLYMSKHSGRGRHRRVRT